MSDLPPECLPGLLEVDSAIQSSDYELPCGNGRPLPPAPQRELQLTEQERSQSGPNDHQPLPQRDIPSPPSVRLDSCTPAYQLFNIDSVLRRHFAIWTPIRNYPQIPELHDPAALQAMRVSDRRGLKMLIRRNGLLPDLRPHLWPAMMARSAPAASYADYREYITHAQVQANVINQIDMDLSRFALKSVPPGHPIRTQLRNILLAFAAVNRRTGYCQGMHQVCMAVLMAGFSELGAFHMFRAIIEHILPDRFYDSSLFGLQVDCRVLEMLLCERRPDIASRLRQLGCPIRLLTIEWFCTLFTAVLPSQLLYRIWDCFIFEGTKVLFRTALVLLVEAADVGGIIAPEVTNMNQMNQRLQAFIESLQSIERQEWFIASMFGRIFGSFPLNQIEEKRCTQRFLLAVEARREEISREQARVAQQLSQLSQEDDPEDVGPYPASMSFQQTVSCDRSESCRSHSRESSSQS